ncbi:AAA-ATPase ASD, mitochondrial [Neltuma alba]|uniref:AAA-ATPase ASD, mitochondrial n=1 Tax=Neltuma alba TaxID=207710 RepID=UPI0010A42E91|nr:AAA-ATPase ASD, mitochondrial-like [Prosopis alba]XP_028778679.1 AAA-ATPase ASD, mitochondrial-like [Prosopis alba]
MEMTTVWAQLGSVTATVMFLYAMFDKFFPPPLRDHLRSYTNKLTSLVSPYVHITFHEFTGERLKRSEAFTAIQTYLSGNSSQRANRLKAEVVKNSQTPLMLSLDDNEEITDEFEGVKLWWVSNKITPKSQSFSFYPASDDRRFFTLAFHRRHRDLITTKYLRHVLDEGKAIASRNRQLRLYTNNPSSGWHGYKSTKWSHVVFEHPATFETLALHPKKKDEILKDLVRFRNAKNYYAKIGKAWKRGYLLYGPPGTGKSTMIAAMANFLNYDIYDVELTAVKDNTELRKLLIETPSKSIMVIEDIDCSLDLTGQRKKKPKETKDDEDDKPKDPIKKEEEEEEKKTSKVTLSGLLNFIDGIWSSCGGERIIVFTTNFVDKLDPALIRRGRMDKHIELSYCCFEAFKVLAWNYLDIETHDLFPRIEELLKETEMTPADVAENLMPKSMEEDEKSCLQRLIEALETAKQEAEKKAEEEAKKKAEEEAKKKAEEEAKEKEQCGKQEEGGNEKFGEGVTDNGFH